MWIPLTQITQRIQIAYEIARYAINDRVLVQINKGI